MAKADHLFFLSQTLLKTGPFGDSRVRETRIYFKAGISRVHNGEAEYRTTSSTTTVRRPGAMGGVRRRQRMVLLLVIVVVPASSRAGTTLPAGRGMAM